MRFLNLAKEVSTWSKDPSTGVGAVIVDKDHRVVSLGFNGFPRGVKDDERLNDRELKYEITVHAEANAIIYARHSLVDTTLYSWPIPPCSRCSSLIIQSGINRVVSVEPPERWVHTCKLGQEMFKEAGVQSYLVEKVDA